MKEVKRFYWKFQPVFGIGFWVDNYEKGKCGIDAWAFNVILPFMRIQVFTLYL